MTLRSLSALVAIAVLCLVRGAAADPPRKAAPSEPSLRFATAWAGAGGRVTFEVTWRRGGHASVTYRGQRRVGDRDVAFQGRVGGKLTAANRTLVGDGAQVTLPRVDPAGYVWVDDYDESGPGIVARDEAAPGTPRLPAVWGDGADGLDFRLTAPGSSSLRGDDAPLLVIGGADVPARPSAQIGGIGGRGVAHVPAAAAHPELAVSALSGARVGVVIRRATSSRVSFGFVTRTGGKRLSRGVFHDRDTGRGTPAVRADVIHALPVPKPGGAATTHDLRFERVDVDMPPRP